MARIKQYCGSYLYEIENGRIKQYCGGCLYAIKGSFTHNELIAILFD